MTKQVDPRAAGILAALTKLAIVLDAQLSDARLQVYVEDLIDLDANRVVTALQTMRRTWKPAFGVRFPSVAEIREQVAGGTVVELEAEALAALARVRQTITVQAGHGEYISEQRVEREIGPAARHALDACGGGDGFRAQSPDWQTKTFVPAYVKVRREAPERFPKLLARAPGDLRIAAPDRWPGDNGPQRIGGEARKLLT